MVSVKWNNWGCDEVWICLNVSTEYHMIQVPNNLSRYGCGRGQVFTALQWEDLQTSLGWLIENNHENANHRGETHALNALLKSSMDSRKMPKIHRWLTTPTCFLTPSVHLVKYQIEIDTFSWCVRICPATKDEKNDIVLLEKPVNTVELKGWRVQGTLSISKMSKRTTSKRFLLLFLIVWIFFSLYFRNRLRTV